MIRKIILLKNIKDQNKILSHHERVHLKKWIAMLGIILLAFLLLCQIYLSSNHSADQDQPAPHIPTLKKLCNVWLIEIGEDNILIYRDGKEESYDLGAIDGALYQPDWGMREQVADVLLADGLVIKVEPLTQKVHGVVLSADENSVEVQGYGHLPLASDYRGYRLYNTLAMCTYKDLAFGYDFADLVMQDGEVCGILMVREETMEDIRVLVKTSDFAALLHEELTFTCDTDFELSFHTEKEEKTEIHEAGEEITVSFDGERFGGIYADSERILIRPGALTGKILLKNVNRSQGMPGYRGQIELIRENHGFAVVNEVSLEDYLYSVVPSEMPASYGIEALKAQAVCARTYAYGHMQHAAYPAYGAHVDDSTSYQVYNNIVAQNSTTRAVQETHGILLETAQGDPAETFYYSTSCGVGSDANVWKTEAAQAIDYLKAKSISESSVSAGSGRIDSENGENSGNEVADGVMEQEIGETLRDEENFREFITGSNPDNFEVDEGWYRWTYQVKKLSPEYMYQVLKARYKANPELVLTKGKKDYVSEEPKEFQTVKNLYIAVRGSGGVADELIIETDKATYKVITEHNIRYVLCDGETKVKRAKGKDVEMPNLLPSGFFVLDAIQKDQNVVGYKLIGGGFGHGVGMSQNAAKTMAFKGYSCEEILTFFYDGCKLADIY